MIPSLDERIKERNATHKKFLLNEHKVQPYIDKLFTILPKDSDSLLNMYINEAYIHVSLEDVEEFEEKLITPISEAFDISWKREVESDEVKHSADLAIEAGSFTIYLIVRSKPTNSCRITKIPTGRTRQVSKVVYVEESEFDYVVECSDD